MELLRWSQSLFGKTQHLANFVQMSTNSKEQIMFSGHNMKITLFHYERIMRQWKLDFSLYAILT